MLIDKKKNVLLDKSRLLSSSASVAFFGILLAVSLLFNVALFLRVQDIPSGISDRLFPSKSGQLGSLVSKMANSEEGKIIVDNKVWIRNDDPLFDVIYLKDDKCKNCIDLEPLQKQLVSSLPTTDAKVVLASSEEGQKWITEGVSVLPAILFSAPFAQTSIAKNLAETGAVSPLANGMFEFRTIGNKRILNQSQLPTLAQPDTNMVTIVGYIDYLVPEINKYFSELLPAVVSQYNDKVNLSLRPFVDNLPSLFVAEAVLCGADPSQIAEVRENYLTGIQQIIPQDTQQISNEQIGAISGLLSNLLGLEGDVLTCYSKNEKAELINQLSAEAKKIGISGTPAFFIGDRFLAGAQPIDTFLNVIGEVLFERGLITAMPTQAAEAMVDSGTTPSVQPVATNAAVQDQLPTGDIEQPPAQPLETPATVQE